MGKLGLMRLALLSPLLSSLYVNVCFCVLRIKLFLIEVQMQKKRILNEKCRALNGYANFTPV
jgi:hypothetical protein